MKRDPLEVLSLAAVIVVTASAEYGLARVCGFGLYVAGAVPGALDIYAIKALRARRDVAAVVVALIVVNALSHLVTTGLLPVSVTLVVAVSAIAPLVMWRVHALRAEPVAVPEPSTRPTEPADVIQEVPAEPEQVPVPVAPAAMRGVPVVLGPWKSVTELGSKGTGTSGGAGPDLAPSPREEAPELEPEPVPELAELDDGSGGTDSSSGDVLELPPGVSAEHIVTVKTWLAVEPELTGTEIGTRLGKSDSYGRRVRRAALAA